MCDANASATANANANDVYTSNANSRKVSRYAGAVEVFFQDAVLLSTSLAVVAWNLCFFTLRLHLRCPGSHV